MKIKLLIIAMFLTGGIMYFLWPDDRDEIEEFLREDVAWHKRVKVNLLSFDRFGFSPGLNLSMSF